MPADTDALQVLVCT